VSLPVVIRPAARRDLVEQSEHIANDSPTAAFRFLEAASDAFDLLGGFPEIGRIRRFLHPKLSGVRSWPIKGFEKHVIFYRDWESRIDILRVIHSARDLPRILGPER
jgi:toxin ParE1/3/4